MPRRSRRGRDDANRAAVRRLRGYANRAKGWLVAWVVVLVGGPVVSCGGVRAFGADGPGIFCCFLGIFSPFVALGGLLLMGGDRGRWARALGLAEEGDDLGLSYTEKPGRAKAAFLRSCATVGDADHELLRNRLSGRFRGRRVVVMDYRSGYGKSSVEYRTTVVWEGEARGVPRFALYPRGWRRRLAEAVGLADGAIHLSGERRFNDAYTLLGGDADGVAACFTDELIELCLRERSLVLEVLDGSLLVFWDGTEFPPAELHERLSIAHRVLRLLTPVSDPPEDDESSAEDDE
jgi:hypothetical protein